MTQQSAVHVLAGSLVLVGLAVGFFVTPWLYLLTAFVGLNLTQYGFTGFCPAQKIFAAMGLKDACACDASQARA